MMKKTKSRTSFFLLVSNILGILLTLLGRISVCNAVESDIFCLKSIKDSLQDPFNSLGTWDFSNSTAGFICRFNGIDCWHVDENKVCNIILSGFGLTGEFPRGIRNCTSLTGLDLSGNKLYGTIPSDISLIVPYVTTLSLSNNQFSGNIPPDIVSCAYLNYLMLDNNNLEGEIPSRLRSLSRLRGFTVQNNEGLCGKPLNECEDSDDSLIWNAAFIQGFVTGWVIFTLVFVLSLFQLPSKAINKIVLSWKKRKLVRTKKHLTSGSDSPNEDELNSNQKILKLEKFVTRMSFMKLAKATSNFSEDYLVGNGMLGKVYKAVHPNGWTIAIKKLHDWENLEAELVSEVTSLGGLRHRNLLPLKGFCAEREERLLVYKYMPNGSLNEWLHSNEDKAKILDFHLRVKIALGIAKGLTWLHYGYELHVSHGNISTRCVLLDQNFEPKISNFWEAKFWSKNDSASSWSLFPEAEYSRLGSYKQDIYCFGIVLLELVTGKEPHELTSSRNLFDHSPCLLDADRNLFGEGINDFILQFLELACNCVRFFPNERPTMLEVYDTLKTISQGRSN